MNSLKLACALLTFAAAALSQSPGPATATLQRHRIAVLSSCTGVLNDGLDTLTYTDTQTTPSLALPDGAIPATTLALNNCSGTGSAAFTTLSLSVPASITGTLKLDPGAWTFTVTAANAPVLSARAAWTGKAAPGGYIVGAHITSQDSGAFPYTCHDNDDGLTLGQPVTMGPCPLAVAGDASESYILDTPPGGQTFRIITRFTVGAPFAAAVEVVVSSEYAVTAGGTTTPPGNSISILYSLPVPKAQVGGGDPLIAAEPTLPPFCAAGTYVFNVASTQADTADIFLQLLDSTGKVIVTSAPQGTAQYGLSLPKTSVPANWGSGCGSANGADQLIFITPQTMPAFNTTGLAYNATAGTLMLQAILVDSVSLVPLATSNQVPYVVEPGVSVTNQEFILKNQSTGTVKSVQIGAPVPSIARALEFSLDSYLNAPFSSLFLDVTLSSDVSTALLNATASFVDSNGKPLTGGELSTRGGVPVKKDADVEYFLFLDADVPPGTTAVTITPYVSLEHDTYKLNLSPIKIPLESIKANLTPNPIGPDCDQPGMCLIKPPFGSNTTVQNTITVSGQVIAGAKGETVARDVEIMTLGSSGKLGSATNPDSGAGVATLTNVTITPGVAQPFSDTVQVWLPSNVLAVTIAYYLVAPGQQITPGVYCSTCAAGGNAYYTFSVQMTTPKGSGGSTGGANTTFANITDKTGHGPITAAESTDDFVSSLQSTLGKVKELDRSPRAPGGLKPHAAHASTTPSNPPLIGIASTWTFNPPIPSDGSFSATISFNYASSQLPDDPNFIESKLQVVSFDSSGALHTYPTTLDTTNKIATAQITDLDPVYSLAVVGPFTQTAVMLATAPTSYALVNTGTQAADVSTTVYQSDGTAKPSASVLGAGNQLVSNGPGWVQAWSNPSTVAGVSWLDNGIQFAALPGTTTDFSFVFTDVEYNSTTSTEIDLTNTSLFDSNVTITLLSANGTVQGTFTTLVPAKNSISGQVDSMFPTLTAGFTGYLTVTSEQTLAASGIRWSGGTATGLVAQPVNNTSFGITSWYDPQLASGVTATLHLVNTNASPANVTLKAWSATGSSAAPSVHVPLASGQQYTGAIATIFGSAPLGSIEVDSDTAGVFGDVLSMDAGFFPNFAVSLPLSGAPSASSVLPYATTSTTVYLFNPNSSAATVTVTPYNATGGAGTHSSASVPANGSAAIQVSSTAYATISSTQPVVAAGWMMVPSGTTTGYLALPATVPAAGGTIGPINGGGTTVEFGNVPLGSSTTGTLTLYNTGSTSLTVSAIVSSDPQFTIVSPSVPFTMAAGSSKAITIQFAPTSAGEQSASLTITAGGSTTLFAPVTLRGQGTGQAATAGLEFGNVPVGSSATGTVTATNIGTVSLTVTAISFSDPEFTVLSPSLPFTLAGSAQNIIIVQFRPTSAGGHTATMTFTANGSTSVFTPVSLHGTGVTGSAPQITAGGVVNAAGYLAKVSRGSLAFAFGTNLATSPAQAPSLPLQLSLGGVSVTVGGIPAPVFVVNAAFVEFQIPYEVSSGPSVPVVVTVNGVPSNAVTVAIADYALGVFTYNRTATIIDPDVFHLNGTLLTPSSPAVPKETVIVIANGIGKLNNPPATGAAVGPPYPTAIDTPVVTVGGVTATSQYAGLLAGDLGVVQMNIQLPANLPSGSLPLVIQFPGGSSPPVNLYVNGNVASVPKLSLSPSALAFGNVTVGQTARLSLTVSNTGNALLTVTSAAFGGNGFSVPSTPFTLAPGGQQGLTVQFTPSTTGAVSASLTIASNDPVNPAATVTVTGTGVAVAADTKTALVAWWKFDETSGATVTDASGENNTGALAGGMTRVAGIFGGGLSFDGSTGEVNGALAGLGFPTGSSARTISAWVNIASAPTSDNAILHYGTAGGGAPANFHLYLTGAGSMVGFGNGYGFGTIAGTSSVADSHWHNVVGVYEGPGTNLARVYVDGVQQATGTLATIPNTGSGTPWRMGNFLAGGTPFRGLMDDVRIYARALSAADVQALFAGQ